jgi:hypothetical protein
MNQTLYSKSNSLFILALSVMNSPPRLRGITLKNYLINFLTTEIITSSINVEDMSVLHVIILSKRIFPFYLNPTETYLPKPL